MIKSLQSLRGIFAIIIVIYHYYSRSTAVVNATACGVSFFFMMSGFALSMHHEVRTLKGFGYGRFLRNRLAKFYPLHLVLTLAMIYFYGINWKLWANVFLVQSWYTEMDVWFSYNGTSWFVASLAFCYLFYALFSYWSHRLKPAVSLAILGGIIVALTTFYFFLPSDVAVWFYYVFPPARLVPFGLGIVLARLCKDDVMQGSASRWGWTALVMLVVVVTIILWPQTEVIPRVYFLSLVWYVPLAVLIVALCKAEQKGSLVTRVLSWKPLVWLGDISFEIYMWQVLVSLIVGKLAVLVIGHQFVPEVYIAVILVLVIPVAWLTHRYFTTPLARCLRAR